MLVKVDKRNIIMRKAMRDAAFASSEALHCTLYLGVSNTEDSEIYGWVNMQRLARPECRYFILKIWATSEVLHLPSRYIVCSHHCTDFFFYFIHQWYKRIWEVWLQEGQYNHAYNYSENCGNPLQASIVRRTGIMWRFPSAIYLLENWNKSICKHLGSDSVINVQN